MKKNTSTTFCRQKPDFYIDGLYFSHTKHERKDHFSKDVSWNDWRRIDSLKEKRKQLQNTVWMLWFCSFRKGRVFCFWFKNDVDTLKKKSLSTNSSVWRNFFVLISFAIEISNLLSCKEKELGDLIDFWNRHFPPPTTPNKHGALPL